MARQRSARHSKSSKQPVTINLEAVDETKSDVSEPEADVSDAAVDQAGPIPGDDAGDISTDAPHAGGETAADPTSGAGQPETPPRSGGSRGSSLVAAVIGGIIALAGAAGLQWAGVLPAPAPEQSSAIDADGIDTRLAAIEQSVAGLPVMAAQSAEEAVRNTASGPGDTEASISALRQQLEGLGTTVAGLEKSIEGGAAGDGAALAQLTERLNVAEAETSRLSEALSAAAQSGADGEKLAAVQTMIEAATQATAGNTARIDKIGTQLDGIVTRISELAAAVDDQSEQPAVARAIAAAALKSAIDRGLPFMSELETYAAVSNPGGEPDSNIATLRGLAAEGVPTLASLQKQLTNDADAIIAAANPLPAESGIVDRLFSSARSLVKTRPVGEAEGESAAAIVARMEAALGAGDLAKVISEAGTLPDASKRAAQNFLGGVKARMSANTIVADTVSGALTPAAGNNQ